MFVRFLLVLVVLALAPAVVVRGSRGGGREQVYVVKPHDTLWSIAGGRYSGDPREAVWKIERRNGLTSPLVHPGERLVLP